MEYQFNYGLNANIQERLEQKLKKVTPKISRKFLTEYLANKVDNILKNDSLENKNYFILARICSIAELSQIEEKDIENLGSVTDYGIDDPNNDFEGKKMYFFNLDSFESGKNTTNGLRANLIDRIEKVEQIHDARAQNGLEREDEFSMSGVAIILLPENVLREDNDKISFGKTSVYNDKRNGTSERMETCFNPEVLEKCDVVCAKDIYSEIQDAMNNYDNLYDFVLTSASPILKQYAKSCLEEFSNQDKQKEIAKKIKLNFEEKGTVESIKSLIDQSGVDAVYQYLGYLGATPNVISYCVQSGILDGENEAIKEFQAEQSSTHSSKSQSYDIMDQDDTYFSDGEDTDDSYDM